MNLRQKMAQLIGGGPPKRSGLWSPFQTSKTPTERSLDGFQRAYGEIGWLFACVSIIASAISATKWHLYQKTGNERKEIQKHPVLDLLNFVNPFQTGQELFEVSQMNLDLVGESFWVLNYNRAGVPAEIWPVNPTQMRIVPSKTKFIEGYIFEQRDGLKIEKVPFDIQEVIHIKYPDVRNPYRGIGPAQSIAVELDTDLYAGRWNRNFFYNDASPGTVLIYPENISNTEYERLKAQWEQAHRGIAQAHKFTILEGGPTLERSMISQKDMDFSELKKLTRTAILGAFRVPESVLGLSETVNRATAEANEYAFARWVLEPRLVRWREKLNEQFLPLFGEGLELGFDTPVPENRELIISEAERGVKAQIMTRNEARQLLGLDQDEKQGDIYIAPQASWPANTASMPAVSIIRKKMQAEDRKDAILARWKMSIPTREAKFASAMRNFFEEQREDILSKLKSTKALHKQKADDIFNKAKWDAMAEEIAGPLLKAILKEAAEDTILDYGLSISFDLSNPHVQEWLGERMRVFSTQINDTTKAAITWELQEGHAAGEGIRELSKRIEGYFEENGRMRATRIARTEVIHASNQGAVEAYQQSKIVQKWEWMVAYAPCSICEPHAGEVHELGYPPPPLHPNCMCTIAGIIEEGGKENRCPQCHKLLGKGLVGGQIECSRCGNIWEGD